MSVLRLFRGAMRTFSHQPFHADTMPASMIHPARQLRRIQNLRWIASSAARWDEHKPFIGSAAEARPGSESGSGSGSGSGTPFIPKAGSTPNMLADSKDVGSVVATTEADEIMESIRNGIAPATKRSFAEIRQDLFGICINPNGLRNGRKILKAPLKGPVVMDWYMKEIFDEPWADLKMNHVKLRRYQRNLERRKKGKGPPKKGEGKKAKAATKK